MIYKGQYKKLKIWSKSHQMVLDVYRATSNFPKREDYSLTSQIRRAAISVSANIVEGCVKSKQSFINHLLIAQGSLEEVKYYLELGRDLEYLPKKDSSNLNNQYVIFFYQQAEN